MMRSRFSCLAAVALGLPLLAAPAVPASAAQTLTTYAITGDGIDRTMSEAAPAAPANSPPGGLAAGAGAGTPWLNGARQSHPIAGFAAPHRAGAAKHQPRKHIAHHAIDRHPVGGHRPAGPRIAVGRQAGQPPAGAVPGRLGPLQAATSRRVACLLPSQSPLFGGSLVSSFITPPAGSNGLAGFTPQHRPALLFPP
jgi:hypothetical protein